MAVETYFLITIDEDGTLTSYTKLPEEPIEALRVATNADVYDASKQVVQEFEHQLLANRVAQTVLSVLMPPQPATTADIVKDKLKERGIDPESAPSAE